MDKHIESRDPYIGIIVPVHNTAVYLSDCIESILKQSFNNFCLLLIDDGSTDNSLEICNKYAQINSRVIVVQLRECGVSAARNYGLEYFLSNKDITHISFVDSDDFIDKFYLEKLLIIMEEKKSDISMCSFTRFNDNITSKNNDPIIVNVYDNDSFWLMDFAGGSDSVLWNKLYKSNVMENIAFPLGKIHEDEFSLHYIIENANSISFSTEVLYYYRKRPKSIMDDCYSQKSIKDLTDAFIDRIIFFHKIGKKPDIKYNTYALTLNYINKHGNNYSQQKIKDIKKIYRFDKKYLSFRQRVIISIKFSKKLTRLFFGNK